MRKERLDNEEISILRECIAFCKWPEEMQETIFGDAYYHISAGEVEQLTLVDDRLRSAKDCQEITFTEVGLMALSKAAINYYQWLGRSGLQETGRLEGYAPTKRVLVQRTIKRLMGWRGSVPRFLWWLISKMEGRPPKDV